MAKKRSDGVNKSKAILDYKKANPRQKPKQISEALQSQGVDVSPGYVSTIISNSKRKPKTGKVGRPRKSVTTASAGAAKVAAPRKARATASSDAIAVDALVKMRKAVEEVGGIDKAKSAISALEMLGIG